MNAPTVKFVVFLLEVDWTPVTGASGYRVELDREDGRGFFPAGPDTQGVHAVFSGYNPTLHKQVRVQPLGPMGAPSSSSPVGGETPPPPPPPPPGKMVVGTNGATGWGAEMAGKLIAAGVRSERLTFQPESTAMENCASPAASKALGFTHDCAVIGNVNDGTLLSAVNQGSFAGNGVAQARICEGSGIVDFFSCGNEMFQKGGQMQADVYGRLYAALKHALVAAGISTPLAFNAWGKGWFAKAVTAVPELKTLIDCLDGHYYGAASEGGDWGPGALVSHHKEAEAAGIINANIVHVTECGCELQGNKSASRPTEQGQVEAIDSALKAFIAGGVSSAYLYTVHDDTTGKWGLVTSPWTPRKALATVAKYAAK